MWCNNTVTNTSFLYTVVKTDSVSLEISKPESWNWEHANVFPYEVQKIQTLEQPYLRSGFCIWTQTLGLPFFSFLFFFFFTLWNAGKMLQRYLNTRKCVKKLLQPRSTPFCASMINHLGNMNKICCSLKIKPILTMQCSDKIMCIAQLLWGSIFSML